MKLQEGFVGGITLAADRRRGLWSTQTFLQGPGAKARRTCGQMPTTATQHSLLAVGLIHALRSFTKTRVFEATKGSNRASIVVTVDDPEFIEAVNNFTSTSTRIGRTGRNLVGSLAQQLRRFDLTFRLPREDGRLTYILRDWARAMLPPREALLEPIFAAAIVGE